MKKNYLKLFIFWFVAIAILFTYFKFSNEFINCLTNDVCLSSHKNTFWLALLHGSFLVLLVFIAKATMLFMGFALRKGFAVYLGGVVLILLGIIGIITLFLVTPQSEILDFIHIIIIGSFLSFFGVFMVYKTWQKRK